jgi:type IV secretory pathway TraG/TraD family ATPase VirD4
LDKLWFQRVNQLSFFDTEFKKAAVKTQWQLPTWTNHQQAGDNWINVLSSIQSISISILYEGPFAICLTNSGYTSSQSSSACYGYAQAAVSDSSLM